MQSAAKVCLEPKLQDAALGVNGRFNSGDQSSCVIGNTAENLAAMETTSMGVATTALEMGTSENMPSIPPAI